MKNPGRFSSWAGGTCIEVRMLRTCSARAGSSFGHNDGRFGSIFIAGKRVLFMSSTTRLAPCMSRTPSFTTSGTAAAATRVYPNATPRPPSGTSMRQKRACSSCASTHLHASAAALAAVPIKWRRVSGMTLLVRLMEWNAQNAGLVPVGRESLVVELRVALWSQQGTVIRGLGDRQVVPCGAANGYAMLHTLLCRRRRLL